MRILQKPIKAKKGQKIEVTFSQPTKVKLLSSIQFKKYRGGKTHRYYGGQCEESPAVFEVPYNDIWHAVIEKGNYNNPIDVEGNAFLVNSDTPATFPAKKPVDHHEPEPEAMAEEQEETEEDKTKEQGDVPEEVTAEEDTEEDTDD